MRRRATSDDLPLFHDAVEAGRTDGKIEELLNQQDRHIAALFEIANDTSICCTIDG